MAIDTQKSPFSTNQVKNLLALAHCGALADELSEYLIEKHGCGWFDGGCFTLAVAVNSIVNDSSIYHVSRSTAHCDHAVVKVVLTGGRDVYFDADGMQTKEQLIEKMREQELTPCTVVEPLTDIEPSLIFQDVVDEFILRFNRINYTEGL